MLGQNYVQFNGIYMEMTNVQFILLGDQYTCIWQLNLTLFSHNTVDRLPHAALYIGIYYCSYSLLFSAVEMESVQWL